MHAISEEAARFENCLCTDTRVGRVALPLNDLYLFDALVRCGDYCYGEMKTYCSLVEPGFTALDIGANIGLMSLLLSELVGADGRVMSFEPSPFINGLLRHNLAAKDRTNVTVHRMAMTDRIGEMVFADPDASTIERLNFGSISLQHRMREENGRNVPTKMTTVDSLDLSKCDFVKIDVEGAEADVLRGAMRTVERFRPLISLETGNAEEDLTWTSALIALDYRIFIASFFIHTQPNFKQAETGDLPKIVCVNAIAVPKERDPDTLLTRLPKQEIGSEAELEALCRTIVRHKPD